MIQDNLEAKNPDESGACLDEFRRELEVRLEIEKAKMKKEQQEALARIEQISLNSIKQAEAEWENYETLLESARSELYRRSRDEMSRLFSDSCSLSGEEDFVSRVIAKILPSDDPEKNNNGGSGN